MYGCRRDPETLARQEALAKKEKMDKDDQERMLEFIERQVRTVVSGERLISRFSYQQGVR